MEVKIKLLNGKLPEKKTEGAACYDCYAAENTIVYANSTRILKLGFAVEIPDGYYAEVRGRSGLSSKGIFVPTGIIDSDYRGEVGAIISNLNKESFIVKKDERICQMIFQPLLKTELKQVEILTETNRGSGGFGSTGK